MNCNIKLFCPHKVVIGSSDIIHLSISRGTCFAVSVLPRSFCICHFFVLSFLLLFLPILQFVHCTFITMCLFSSTGLFNSRCLVFGEPKTCFSLVYYASLPSKTFKYARTNEPTANFFYAAYHYH